LVLICLMMRSLIILASLGKVLLLASSLALIASSGLESALVNEMLLVVLAKGLNCVGSVPQVSLSYDVLRILLVVQWLFNQSTSSILVLRLLVLSTLSLGSLTPEIKVNLLHIWCTSSVSRSTSVIHSFLWIVILALISSIVVVLLI